jgi:hypothetical protein
MAQAAPQNQEVLGYKRECRKNTNLLCYNHLLLVAIIKHDMKLERSVYEILQIIGISLTDKTHLRDLFDKSNINNVNERFGSSEPSLFNF